MSTGIDIPVKVTEASEAIALLNRIATAVEGTGRAAEQAEEKTSSLGDAFNSLGEKARNFNEIRESVMALATGLLEAATAVADLASEQQALDANSARLRLNFQQAAQQAGGFVSELQTMTLATSMANRGINLTQTELDALARIGMQRARDTGKNLDEVFDQLGESIIEGGEELTKFGSNLSAVAGETGTVAQRMAILVGNARQMPPAMRTAADEVNNFKNQLHQAQRTMAEGFTAELQRLQQVSNPFAGAARDTEEFNRELRAVGQTAAYVGRFFLDLTGIVMGFLGTAVIAARAYHQIQGLDLAGARQSYEQAQQTAGFMAERARSLSALMEDQERQRTTVEAARPAAAPRPAAPAAPAAAPAAPAAPRAGGGGGGARAPRAADLTITAESLAEEERARVQALAASDAAFMERRRTTDEHLRAMQDEIDRSNEELRAAVAQRDRERGEREFAMSDAGLRHQAETERLARQEQRTMDFRLRSQRTFTDEMEELAQRRITLAEHEAQLVTGSFNAMGRAFSSHLTAVIEGRESVGEALQGMLADTLKTISQEAAVKAGMELASGFAALAIGNVPGAGAHFTASGLFAGVAALAGVAGAAISPASAKANESGAGAEGGGEGARSATPMGGGGGGGGRGETVINIAFNGPQFGTGGVVQAAREVVSVINRGAIQGAVQLNAAAVGRLR